MNHQLLQYITFARDRKLNDQDIRDNLIGAGWHESQVDAALAADDSALLMPPPPPGTAGSEVHRTDNAKPIAVIQQRTTRGLEYIIMFIAMGVTAISLGALLHNLVDTAFGYGGDYDGVISFASSALIVALPIFAVLFLRLKRAEQADSTVRQDASRRHAVQLTLVVAFLWGLFRLVTFIYSLINGGGAGQAFGSNISSPFGNLLHTLITVGIAGSIFAYYWIDEHRKDQR